MRKTTRITKVNLSLEVSIDQPKNNPFYVHPRYAFVIATVPREPLFRKDVIRCDYFLTSVKMNKADVYKVDWRDQ